MPISYEEILRAAGKTQDEIQAIVRDLASVGRAGQLLSHCAK
jgi:hypothetical protein